MSLTTEMDNAVMGIVERIPVFYKSLLATFGRHYPVKAESLIEESRAEQKIPSTNP